MKTQYYNILAGVLFLLLSSKAGLAETKTETYQGTYQGDPCSVTINWANYSGQGAVEGKIITNSGIVMTFFGENPRKGYMEIEIQGKLHQLNKSKSGNSISWGGKSLSFNRGGGVMRPPVTTPVPNRGFRKDYIGSWRGDKVTAYLNFVPDSDPDVLYTADGEMVRNGKAFAISVWQPRSDYLEIEIDTDSENHKLTTKANGGKISWAGRWVSLTEKITGQTAPGGGGQGTVPKIPISMPLPKPPVFPTMPKLPTTGLPPKLPTIPKSPNPPVASDGVWIIACEAQANKSGAEKDAAKWRNRGFHSEVIWIPDYSSLSGTKMWLTYVGRFDYRTGKAKAMNELKKVRQFYRDATGLKLDQSERRETL